MPDENPRQEVECADSMREAGRKMLRRYEDALRANEEGARAGEDADAVHDMRVAGRRMRASLRMLEPYVPGKAVPRLLKELRGLHQALGAVRDLDVLIGQARDFRDGLPPEQQGDLDGLLDEWSGRRKRARKKLRAALDSADYTHFLADLDAFLAEEEPAPDQTAEPEPYQVRHVAGPAIGGRYAAVRAYETVMPEASMAQWHALRIAAKYLRYTLEFFRDVLPPEGDSLVETVTQMQDQLGALHDADVMIGLIGDFEKAQDKPKHHEAAPGLAAYRADREAATWTIREGFAPLWALVVSPEWRARLALAVAAI